MAYFSAVFLTDFVSDTQQPVLFSFSDLLDVWDFLHEAVPFSFPYVCFIYCVNKK